MRLLHILQQSGTFLWMEATVKTVLVVFMLMAMGQAREDMENIVMKMRMELNAVNEGLAKEGQRGAEI